MNGPRRIALFASCLVDGLFPQAGVATATVLRRLGFTVDFPRAQTCCGQMHINSGYPREALPLVRRYVQTFAEYEAVVAPSASCVGSVRNQHAALAAQAGDADLAEAAARVGDRTFELSQFLVDIVGIVDVGAQFPYRVTYHPTCHSLRVLRVGDRPLRLLRAVRGLELVELPNAESCCGFGGTFAVKNSDVSTAMLIDKLSDIADVSAEVCAAADASCLMHIGGGLARAGSSVRPMHLAEILASTESEPALAAAP